MRFEAVSLAFSVEEQAAGSGECHAARAALEELHAQLLLERRDLTAHRALRDEQPLRRAISNPVYIDPRGRYGDHPMVTQPSGARG